MEREMGKARDNGMDNADMLAVVAALGERLGAVEQVQLYPDGFLTAVVGDYRVTMIKKEGNGGRAQDVRTDSH